MTTSDALVRQQRLATRVQGLRLRSGSLTSSDRWMLVVGGTLVPLGLVLVLLGWVGASRTVLVFEQVPYLISGGLLGLALVVAGGFTYFAYWLTVMVRENRETRQALVSVLSRMELLLEAKDAPAPRTAAPAALVATKAGSMVHRADCATVEGRDGLRPVTAQTKGLSACKLCEPFAL
jgi:hypothetical protein